MKIKNINLDIHKENPLMNLFLDFSGLKRLYRQGWLQNGINENICESVAEHSFSTALTAWMLATEYFPKLDSNKVLQLAIVHDLGEIHAGDFTPSHNIDAKDKSSREQESVKKTFQHMKTGRMFIDLWKEYEEESSPEAVFVKQIDKIEMILQAVVYEHTTGINLSSFKDSIDLIKNSNLRKMIREILDSL